jgi:hypothetical protein
MRAMANKVDRPADFGGDGIVVYVAKSIEEVNKTRSAFSEAEIPVELPAAAIEAMWAAGRTSLPIRVTPDAYKAALDVIDELFPPPELVLPDPEPEPAADGNGDGAAPSRSAPGAGDEGPTGPALSHVQAEGNRPAKKQADLGKLKFSLLKLLFMAGVSLVVPGIGIALALFALWGSVWVWRKLDMVIGGESAMTRAKFAMGLSGFAVLWGVGMVVFLAWQEGVFG